jgi:hypothetical protein
VAPPAESARPDVPELGERAIDDSRLAIGLHYASLPLALVPLAYMSRRQWFYSDDFQVLTLTSGWGVRELFQPFAEHWMTAPKALAELNLAVFGFRTYWPTLIGVMVVNVVVTHLLWRLMRQMYVSAWIATGLCAAYVVSCGNAVLFSILQAGWFAAIALGLAVIMLANYDGRDPRRDAFAVVIAVLSLAVHSGVAIAILVAAVLVALLRRGARRAVLLAIPPAAAYGIWLLVIGRDRPFAVPTGIPHSEVPRFVVSKLTSGVADVTPLVGPLAALALIMLAAWLVWRAPLARSERAPAYAMAIGAVVVYLAIALGRGKITYRYSYLAWLLLLPAVALVLQELGRRATWRRALGIGVGVVLGLVGLYRFNVAVHDSRQLKEDARQFILSAAALTETEPYVPDVIVNQRAAPLVRARHLAKWRREDRFPALGTPSADDRRAITPLLQVRFVKKPPPTYRAPARPQIEAVSGARPVPSEAGCVRVQSLGDRREIQLSVTELATISLAGVDQVSVEFPENAADGEIARTSHRVRTPEYLEFAPGTRPLLVLPPDGVSTICGVDGGT